MIEYLPDILHCKSQSHLLVTVCPTVYQMMTMPMVVLDVVCTLCYSSPLLALHLFVRVSSRPFISLQVRCVGLRLTVCYLAVSVQLPYELRVCAWSLYSISSLSLISAVWIRVWSLCRWQSSLQLIHRKKQRLWMRQDRCSWTDELMGKCSIKSTDRSNYLPLHAPCVLLVWSSVLWSSMCTSVWIYDVFWVGRS